MKHLLYILLCFSFSSSVLADEGMWLPLLLGNNYEQMQKMGLKLSCDQLYDINHSSLKDAVVMLDGGDCTGEIISDKGLLITNHHCGFGEIQAHSSLSHDYLENGFWAMRIEDELPNPEKTASFLIWMEDVSQKILPFLTKNMSESERNGKIEEIEQALIAKATEGTIYNASVESMFEGNAFYLFVYETFNDIRLVGAPPSSIGDFGGDTDNFMYPRHTADFCIFRVYSGPDGKPASYSPDNIPYKPKFFLPISINGVKEYDFSMIWGYPGSTERYLTSYGVKYNMELYNPIVIKTGEILLNNMKEKMDSDPNINIQYASKYAGYANYWKLYSGQNPSLRRLNVYEKKLKEEIIFKNWVNADSTRISNYGHVLNDLEKAYQTLALSKADIAITYFNLIYGKFAAEIIRFSGDTGDLLDSLNAGAPVGQIINVLKKDASKHYKDYDAATDKKIMVAVLNSYYKDVLPEYQPDFMQEFGNSSGGNFQKFADDLFEKSLFSSEEKFNEFLNKPSAAVLENDPAYKAYLSLVRSYYTFADVGNETRTRIIIAKRKYLEGLLEMNASKLMYPDANSTMRCTFGKVIDYFPADAVHYSWRTTLEGVMQKEDPENHEFNVSQKLKDIYNARNYGVYGEDSIMPVCFITDHDISGGNSGSPVINGNGELVGLAFDSNWEGLTGDISFSSAVQRTVCVDIRYILLIIDKYAGAKNLIDELKIVKN